MSVKRQVVNEIHKPARKNFARRRVILKGLNDLFQADLVEMIPYARQNRGYKYILVVINCFSKFVYALPLKRKTGADVSNAIEKVLQSVQPVNIQTDLGKEFYNVEFQSLMKKYNINHYSSYSNLKSSIVERCNRTLKMLMWKEFSYHGSYKWLSLLPKIVDKYNSSIHSTTGYRPKDVNFKNAKRILSTAYSNVKTIDPTKQKFYVGDNVRISKYRTIFDKAYEPNWSSEIFKVIKVRLTNPRTYILEDIKGEIIKGGFYEFELLRAKYPDVYLVEKVLRRRGNQLYVKWLGYNATHNSWIPGSSVV